MSKQLYESLLNTLVRANKDYKLKLAIRAGYTTVEEYKTYLQGMINGSQPETVQTNELKTIHIVDVVDCSGSMDGGKIRGAQEAINAEIKRLQADNTAEYIYSLCKFSNREVSFPISKTDIVTVGNLTFRADGGTPLLDAIGMTIDRLKVVNNTTPTLINIYTDGGENTSERFNRVEIRTMIQLAEKNNCTVTFIGTEQDLIFAINQLGVDRTNTLAYDGSAEGLKMSFMATSNARSMYKDAVNKGEDVSKGFYKKIVKK